MSANLAVDNGMDLMDLMGPDATREDYVSLARIAGEIADNDEMWTKES